jgi:glycine hydroxymethyltransferase
MNPSGIRIGTPAMTTRGWKEKDFEELGVKMAEIIKGV